MHKSGALQTTGEAIYCDDIRIDGKYCYLCVVETLCTDCLHLAFVLSTSTHAEIVSIDTTDALAIDGVIGYFDHRDVPASNMYSYDCANELFPSKMVQKYQYIL
jgi:xanthine dehydrogenase/oxidase